MPFLMQQLLVGLAIELPFFGGLLFLLAGTLDWWRAWVILAVIAALTIATTFLVFPGREDLLRERTKFFIQKDQPLYDKIAVSLFVLGFVITLAAIPLDVFHFHWLPQPDGPVSALGMALLLYGWYLISLAFRDNAFASPVVRLQSERHQTVSDQGIYAHVRHPMYIGCILWQLGMTLWLESYAAALVSIFPAVTLMVRITNEEKFLKANLDGYADYTTRVRYRLVPFLW